MRPSTAVLLFSKTVNLHTTSMNAAYFEDQVYESTSHESAQLLPGTYERCRFLQCNFSESDLSDYRFLECEFHHCNLDRVVLINTSLSEVKFIDCKMMGISFEHCHRVMFTPYFENCLLNFSNFFERKMPGIVFKDCNLTEVDFTAAILSEAVFTGCDFTNARFDRTVLTKTDFRGAFNFSIDPENNDVRKAKFSLATVQGLLQKYGILIEG